MFAMGKAAPPLFFDLDLTVISSGSRQEALVLPETLAERSSERGERNFGRNREFLLGCIILRGSNIGQFKQRYLNLHEASPNVPIPVKKSTNGKLRRSVILEDENDFVVTPETHTDPSRPWGNEYDLYLSFREIIPEGMDAIKWWGVRTFSQNILNLR